MKIQYGRKPVKVNHVVYTDVNDRGKLINNKKYKPVKEEKQHAELCG
jgi:hypothetical protein